MMYGSRTHAIGGRIALIVILVALLGGCDQAGPDPFAYRPPSHAPLRPGGGPVEGQGILPAPFALTLPTPTNTPAAGIPPTPTATLNPDQTVFQSPLQATPTALPPAMSPLGRPTVTPEGDSAPAVPAQTASPTATPATTATPVIASPTAPPAPTATASPSETALPSPTPAPTATRSLTRQPANTATPTPTPVPPPATHTPAVITPAPITWDLAEDIVGMWDYEEDGWLYYFDFLDEGRVIVSYGGIWPYRIQDQRTLVIERPEGEWPITVLELTAHQLTLADVVNEVDRFYRAPAVVNIESEMIGLWLDENGEHLAVEFAAFGDTVGDFGRGTYEVVSGNSVLIECDDAEACANHQEVEQGEPLLTVRIFQAAEGTLTLRGFGIEEPWDLERQPEQANLDADIIGLWQDEDGRTVEFAADGTWVENNALTGSYEVMSNTTLWVVLDGQGRALVVVELTADRLSYSDWGYFEEEDRRTFERVDGP